MVRSAFFRKSGPFTIAEIIGLTDAQPPDGSDLARVIADIAPFPTAGADDVTFLTDRKLLMNAENASAGACFISPENAERLPAATLALVTPHAEAAFARIIGAFYPQAEHAEATGMRGDVATTTIDPTARLEEDVSFEPGVVIGPEAEIGAGTVIGANTVIGRGVKIGRRCLIGPCASILYALVGNDVIIHAGARIGCDGFGYAPGPRGFVKLPQIGRVIIQDHVEIGANAAIDRGALGDTTIGEGTKIDNLVQIAHNVTIGRSSAFAAQVGLSGSTHVGDGVVMGGKSGTMPHVVVGDRAQVAGGTGITGNVAPGQRVAGSPHRPFDKYMRELRAIARLVRSGQSSGQSAREVSGDGSPDGS